MPITRLLILFNIERIIASAVLFIMINKMWRILVCLAMTWTLSTCLCFPNDDIFSSPAKSYSGIVRDRLSREIDYELGNSKRAFKSKGKEQGKSIFDSFPLD